MDPTYSSIKRIDLISVISILERLRLAGLSFEGGQRPIRGEAARIDVVDQVSGEARCNLVERMLRHPLNFSDMQKGEDARGFAECRASHGVCSFAAVCISFIRANMLLR
ncbi:MULTISPECIES: hypothetical protein [Rhizobium]|uniref:hypothetical protein n=1 Tax=Rhizobium sp. 11_C7_N12_5 TaxID=3240770 RepID=UPI0012E0A87F